MFPINANSPVAETVVFFYGMHAIGYVVGNHALQFADKASESLHRGNVHESGFLKPADVARDRGEVLIDAGKAVVHREFSYAMLSFKMLPSHFLSCVEGIWSGIRQRVQRWRVPSQASHHRANRKRSKQPLASYRRGNTVIGHYRIYTKFTEFIRM